MNAYAEAIQKLATGGMLGGSIWNSITPKRANFEDVQELSSTVVAVVMIVLILLIVLYIVLCIAVYKLTGSVLQLILFILFGFAYLWIALIAYAFSGHRFVKVK